MMDITKRKHGAAMRLSNAPAAAWTRRVRTLVHALAAMLFLAIFLPSPARAADCYVATAQGSTGPTNWQTYCWIDFTGYNDTAARSSAGQNFSIVLQDGTTMTFNLKVTSGAALTAVTSPSWSGAAVGNTAFLGIAGEPVLYQTAAGTSTITISNIVLTPPSGANTVTSYMMVAADGESSNEGEQLRFQTNGAPWVMLDQSGPVSGSSYPSYTGSGTQTFTVTGVGGTVGSYIVGSSTPTTITSTLVGGGLQGAMFAVRFATIRLNTRITGTRVNAADQFTFAISATSNGATLASGTSSGTGLGPFTAAALSSASAIPLTLSQTMAAGSVSAISRYRSSLTCTNATSSSTPMPSNTLTTSHSFGTLQFGDNVTCTFTETPFPHLTLRKVLGSQRRFSTDQFTLRIEDASDVVVATTTTTGTSSTVNNGTTPLFQATPGAAYQLLEVGAGATALAQYTATMACTNANATSTTGLPTAPGGTITPAMGDVVTCTITNTRLAFNALVTVTKSAAVVSDPINGTANPKAIPGAIVRYSFLVANTGPASVDTNTVWLIDKLPPELSVGTAASPVFTQGSPTSALTFTASTDIRYSNAVAMPTSFAACTYTPVSAYDPAVNYICLNPKGTMAGSSGTPPNFTLSIQAQVN